jgi:hypothetical protein
MPSSYLGLRLRFHLYVWAGLLALILALIALNQTYAGRDIWNSITGSSELRRSNYAERIYRQNFFRTRANTWSNLAYIALGFYAFAWAAQDRRRASPTTSTSRTVAASYVVATPALSVLFGLTCCGLGFGSGYFHATLTRFGQQLDVASMYGPLLVFLTFNLGRWWPRVIFSPLRLNAPSWPLLCSLVVLTSALLFYYKWSMSATNVLSTLILCVAACSLVDRFRPAPRPLLRWQLFSIIALIAAVTCRQLDVAGRFSGPDAWLQGHALWHLLTAMSIGCTYLYYRSSTNYPFKDEHQT